MSEIIYVQHQRQKKMELEFVYLFIEIVSNMHFYSRRNSSWTSHRPGKPGPVCNNGKSIYKTIQVLIGDICNEL